MKISILQDDHVSENKSGFLGSVAITHYCASLSEFSGINTQFHICCGVFNDNKRCKSSFHSIGFLQFDFDSGTTVESVVNALGSFDAVISASKNHLRDKGDGKGVIPRFHLFLPLVKPITDASYYSFYIEHL